MNLTFGYEQKNAHLEDLRPLLLAAINHGLSQSQVARKIGLTRATVNAVVHSNRPWMPRYATGALLISLCEEEGLEIVEQVKIPAPKEQTHA